MTLSADALAAALVNLRAKEDALSEAMGEVERRGGQIARQMVAHEWISERAKVAEILRTFYRAPISMSSVFPILTLAESLNPDLVPLPKSWQPFVRQAGESDYDFQERLVRENRVRPASE